MEEQNKNTEKKENEVQTSQENTPQNATPTRSYVLMILAGCYLLYTGYRLCKNVIDGVDGGSWGFFAAGIGFLIVGAVMLFVGGKNLLIVDGGTGLYREWLQRYSFLNRPQNHFVFLDVCRVSVSVRL